MSTFVPPPASRHQRRRSERVEFTLSPAEKRQLVEIAEADDLSIPAELRYLVALRAHTIQEASDAPVSDA